MAGKSNESSAEDNDSGIASVLKGLRWLHDDSYKVSSNDRACTMCGNLLSADEVNSGAVKHAGC